MNKAAIKRFAIEARKKLMASVSDKAGMLGITEKDFQKEPVIKGADFEIYKTAAGTEVTLNRNQCEQRRLLVAQMEERGFEAVIEEVAYTWFNRICAIRFMEVNDYLPTRVRVLSSEKEGKYEPDLVTEAPEVNLNFTDREKEYILEAKMNNKLDDLFKMLLIKQCNKLHEILPELFEETEDYTEMLLNISYINEDDVIYMLVNAEDGIPEADFNVTTVDEQGKVSGQVEIIGWLYQYYNNDVKDDTFAKMKKNIKIAKERIPAATQLFTPDWIVRYMVENSIGRLWIEHLKAIDSYIDEKSTAEKFGWKYYLPEAEQKIDVSVKLEEIRTSYKNLQPTDITCIDPCMGSGHILIAMFDVLMDIYKSAGYSDRDAAFEIVEKNIHGLDIDKRAHQLSYFAVMMKGRGYNRRFFHGRDDITPVPNVYAIMDSKDISKLQLKYFGNSLDKNERNLAVQQIDYLLELFFDAREYGSLINVNTCNWKLLKKFIDDLDMDGQISFDSVGSERTQEKLNILISIAKTLSIKYDSVITNPPYMGRRKGMNPILKKFVETFYKDSKADLYSCFIEKCISFTKINRYTAMITQQSFMFTDDFKALREKIIESNHFTNMIHLGADAFPEINGEVVQTAAFVINAWNDEKNYIGKYVRLVDYSCNNKPSQFVNIENIFLCDSNKFLKIKAYPFSYWLSNKMIESFDKGIAFEDYGVPRQGMATGDNDTFLRLWYEVDFEKIGFGFNEVEDFHESKKLYLPYNKGGKQVKWYGNNDYVIRFDKRNYDILSNQGNHLPSRQYYCHECITWSDISGRTFATRYCTNGYVFDVKGSCGFPKKENLLYAMALLNSKLAPKYVEALNPTTTTQVGDLKRIPVLACDNKTKEKIDNEAQRCIDISREFWDMSETSWNFKKNPLIKYKASGLIADTIEILRNEYSKLQKELLSSEIVINKLFIKTYQMEDEINSNVNRKDLSYGQFDEIKIIEQFIAYAVGCMFGRYSLDKEGIVCTSNEINESNYNSFLPDVDNIIPLNSEEYFEDDIVGRFVDFVKVSFGNEYLEENLEYIANILGNKGDNSRDRIRTYFLNDFYKMYCSIYSITGSGKRPVIWLFDSGRENGFKALIYIHRYNKELLGKLRTDYLHRVQKSIEQRLESMDYIISSSASSVEKGKAQVKREYYIKQLSEIDIYDQALAHIANQRISLNLDDGIVNNYKKFQNVIVKHEGKSDITIDLLAVI